MRQQFSIQGFRFTGKNLFNSAQYCTAFVLQKKDTDFTMRIKKHGTKSLSFVLEPDRLKKVLRAADRPQVDILKEVTRKMQYIASGSALEALRSNKRK
jgi:hypothetical protein